MMFDMAFNFSSTYDENLMDNIFFQTLQKEFSELFLKAITENCVICVPKSDSFPRYLLVLEDFLAHILVPTEELLGNHFTNLCGARVKISNRVITVHHEVGRHNNAYVLFQETFYTKDGLKYEVLCIDRPLDEGVAPVAPHVNMIDLYNYKDCFNFLWTESENYNTIESVNKEVNEFLKKFSNLDVVSLEDIKNLVSPLYMKCLEIVLRNPNIKKKYKLQKNSFNNLKLAVETYLQQGIYNDIVKVITSCTESDDSKLNKIIRNCADLHFKDFKLNPKLYSNIPKARLELSKISSCNTSLGKLSCLKRTIVVLSENNSDKFLLNADDLLQVLAFLIIKTNLPNWHAQLKFLKLFSHLNHSIFDENSYLISSLEAAITCIQTGMFCKQDNYKPRSKLETEEKETEKDCTFKDVNEDISPKEKIIYEFFRQVALGNLDNVKKMVVPFDCEMNDYKSLNVCHPLCTCDKCSTVFNTLNICPSVNSCDDQGLTPLHIACMYNVPNIVEYLLCHEANCNATDCDGKTPAHYAALRGHQNALLLLLHKGADLNAQDNSLNTPLHLCSNNGHDNCVKALIYFSEYLGAKLNVNQVDFRGDTPLHHAAKWGYRSIVRILLESGSDPTILNKKKFSAIDYAHNPKVLQLLREKCGNIDHYIKIKSENSTIDLGDQRNIKSKFQRHKGIQPNSMDAMRKVEKVLKAVENGDVNLLCFYMGMEISEFIQAERNKSEENGSHDYGNKCHPLCTCSKCSEPEISCQTSTRAVQAKGLNINICNSDGWTPLHVASKQGNVDIVRGLIKNGASVNVQTLSKVKTPLMLACEYQNQEVVKELLKSGCNIDLQDHKLKTALHYACNTGNTKLVELLLKYEPNLQLRNSDNKTALHEAKDKVFFEIISVLKGVPP